MMCGQGTLIYSNGCRYEGNFWYEQLHGRGTMYYPDGEVVSGTWDRDVFIG